MNRPHSRRLLALAVAVAAWLALFALLLWIYYQPAVKRLAGDEVMYQHWAQALLAGRHVAVQFIWPPGQAWFLAAIYAVTGVHVLAAQLVQGALLALCVGLLWRLWRALDGAAAAAVAAALFAFNPSIVANAHWLWPEVPHLACLLAALALLQAQGRWPRCRALGAGLLVGLALLFKSLLTGFWPLFLLAFLRRDAPSGPRGHRWHYRWGAALLFLAGLAAATGPSMVHGYRHTGRPLIANSSIFNLYLGLTDVDHTDYRTRRAGGVLAEYLHSGDSLAAREHAFRVKIAGYLAAHGAGEVVADQLGKQYFRLFNTRTLLLSQFPGRACEGHLGAYAPSPWLGPLDGYARAMHLLTLVLAAFGIAAFRRWRRPLALFVIAFFGYQLALYAGLHVMQRYLLPMLPFLCGFAGSFAVAAVARLRGQDVAALSLDRWRLLAGAALAALLLVLALVGPLLDSHCMAG
ncbi:MAG TPA: glycosyltransferase family 39 protein [Rhodanobacteraceae bacterium]|nr:glycosyltransferase family 39 protein [Rhodanobacteraceae bacterium]